MHHDEISINPALVEHLINTQFPRWKHLPLESFNSMGTDNAIYRLGPDMAVRLPRRAAASTQIEKECRWLPAIAPHLTLAVSAPIAAGQPTPTYPHHWSVCRWLEGANALEKPICDLVHAASSLALFISELQKIDASASPKSGEHNFFRGVSLAQKDAETRAAIAYLRNTPGLVDTHAASQGWSEALAAPAWSGSPVWLHGDLHPGNLLVQNGRLSAVIDFGGLGVGDPACDSMAAWTLLSGPARQAFCAALAPDDATWARGRGWALSVGLVALPYYLHTNPALATIALRTIKEVLAN